MKREEAVALLERYSNYDGIGIPNLAGCKEAMKVAVDALKEAFPELAESEDERIRKEMLKHFNDALVSHQEVTTSEQVKSWIAYLEKRKEQKPAPTEDMPYICDEHFYEREPADSFKYKLAEYMTRCCTKKEGPYGYEYGISAESILKMAEEELLKRGVVQKPVEWSKNDTAFLNEITDFFENKTVRLQHDIDMYAHWLKSLPERFVLQKYTLADLEAEWKHEYDFAKKEMKYPGDEDKADL